MHPLYIPCLAGVLKGRNNRDGVEIPNIAAVRTELYRAGVLLLWLK